MTDTVKLIVELPTDKYLAVKTNIINDFIYDAVKHGTPLDDVKTRMQKLADAPCNMVFGSASQGLEAAIEILDNIGKENDT